MSEFNNRIIAQRNALKIVNKSELFSEPLLGLNEKVIDRWSRSNRIAACDPCVVLLKSISETLFFLANKSQEQVTEDYKTISETVDTQLSKLKLEISRRNNS